jgi:hypothetical protein
MLTDWELWACANQVLLTHGEASPRHVAEQIGALAVVGDAQGIATWQEIARRLSELVGLDTASTERH